MGRGRVCPCGFLDGVIVWIAGWFLVDLLGMSWVSLVHILGCLFDFSWDALGNSRGVDFLWMSC